jgi:hypothetical protein
VAWSAERSKRWLFFLYLCPHITKGVLMFLTVGNNYEIIWY